MKKELKNLGIRTRRGGLNTALREIKMFAPSCLSDDHTGFRGCQDAPDAPWDWWNHCSHDPYFSKQEKKEITPILEKQEDGTELVTGHDEKVVYIRRPNIKQIAACDRHNAGVGVGKAMRNKGYILPEEHPTDPHAPFCQYRDCYSQNIQFRTRFGDFCDERQAKAVAMDELGIRLEMSDEAKRADQFRKVRLYDE